MKEIKEAQTAPAYAHWLKSYLQKRGCSSDHSAQQKTISNSSMDNIRVVEYKGLYHEAKEVRMNGLKSLINKGRMLTHDLTELWLGFLMKKSSQYQAILSEQAKDPEDNPSPHRILYAKIES